MAKSDPDTTTIETAAERKLPVVAYNGGFELLAASWDLSHGRTVKFRLAEEPGRPILMHPFAAFTRRRGGRVGTRFHMAMTKSGMDETMFNGEVMLMSGGQPLGQGFWVSFWLDDEASHHPFAGYRGRKGDNPGELFYAAFVELDDDDQAIDQDKRQRVEDAHDRKEQKLSVYSASLCRNPMFIRYLSERVSVNHEPCSEDWWWEDEHAAHYIRVKCRIESRSELDRDQRAATIFHEQIREPYSDWRSVNE